MNRSLAIILLVIIGCGSLELLQARSAPLPDRPHKRWVRRRVSPHDPDLEIVEVKTVYFVRRPKKVVTHPISEDEMDRRMRCDFEPHRSECQGLSAIPAPPKEAQTITDDSMDRRIRCAFDPTADDCKTDSQAAAVTQPPPPPRSTTRATTTTTASTTTTTTEFPLLPELTEPEEVDVEEQTTTEADFPLPEEDDEDEFGDGNGDGDEDTGTPYTGEDDMDDEYDTDQGIGPNDQSDWNAR